MVSRARTPQQQPSPDHHVGLTYVTRVQIALSFAIARDRLDTELKFYIIETCLLRALKQNH